MKTMLPILQCYTKKEKYNALNLNMIVSKLHIRFPQKNKKLQSTAQ